MTDSPTDSSTDPLVDDPLDPEGLETLGAERPDDVRISADEGDDDPVVPPDMQPRATEWGTTEEEQLQGETIEQRIAQEEPDPQSAYGRPEATEALDEFGLPATEDEPVGGGDPDAIPAEDDWLGDGEVGGGRSVRLVSDDEGDRPDTDAQAWGRDAGFADDGGTAEESAMHVIDDEDS